MSSSVLNAAQISEYANITNEPKSPVNVESFVNAISNILAPEYMDPKSNKFNAEGRAYMVGLYNHVVFNGKEFKESIPRCGSQKDKAVSANPIVPTWVDCGTEIYTHGKQLLAFVIRGGSDSTSVHSVLHRLPDNKFVPVMTYRLFQAVISIMMVKAALQKRLLPAKLFANVNLSCKVSEAAPHLYNWAIHGHSGINFVANYVHNLQPSKENDLIKKRMPSLESILMMAFRMDQSQRNLLIKLKSRSMFPTVESIFRSTGISASECELLLQKLKECCHLWGNSYISLSNSMTEHFVGSLQNLERGSTSSASVRSNMPSIDEEEDAALMNL